MVTNAVLPSQEIVDKFVNMCHGRLEQVKSLLEEYPGLINAVSSQKETGIQAAAHTAQKEIATFLLSKGAPLDICTAAMLGLEDEVRSRLQVDPGERDATGAHGLPLMQFAALGGALAIVRLVAEHGAAVNGGEGISTPLHAAVWADRPEIVDWLIGHGARTDAKDFTGKTPRQSAEAATRERVLQIFDQHGIR